ncbi:HNH endonuclease [Aeromonas phage BUCT695]|uniref:HNH endonuclease n=1 Tax=Aeromonas phage BUCT695 TaxID=2908630 RepID=UPI0023297F58|nr:HNH endonuclease [Aeromonas phage BUCT695]UIW10564.1 HNH homing endonuclease [Aeromonas phage BUCT695]
MKALIDAKICRVCKIEKPLSEFHQCVYQFHHLEPHTKEGNSANIRNWDKLREELDKCVMLCANCHMIRHWGDSHE